MLPSFREDERSQIPALQLLQNLGYTYLTPEEALLERNNKKANVVLEGILETQLKKINKIHFKNKEYSFSDINIKNAIKDLKDIPYDGLIKTSEKVYDLLTLGKSYEQNIDGDNKSFNIKYIDWDNIENNVFHVTEEFEVERTSSNKTCRPDIILFVNGIPFVVIECKRPDIKDPIIEAISQNIRNQTDEYIPKLFTFTNIVMGVSSTEAMYATTGTQEKFWAVWEEKEGVKFYAPTEDNELNTNLKEDTSNYNHESQSLSTGVKYYTPTEENELNTNLKEDTSNYNHESQSLSMGVKYYTPTEDNELNTNLKEDTSNYNHEYTRTGVKLYAHPLAHPLSSLINKPLTKEQNNKLFLDRPRSIRSFFENMGDRLETQQDKAIYSLLQPKRLIDLSHKFIVFDNGEKKICRYQQYFAIQETLKRVKNIDPNNVRAGGVVWHTQGSGKSLTMVMLAKSLALDPEIKNPRIVLVTDRVDLDVQINKTFTQCGKSPKQATTGTHLLELIESKKHDIITTVIDKFDSVIKKREIREESNDIFILVDESHRSQYGSTHVNMRKVFPKACYIGFTGTPLMKKDKSTVNKFGGIIHQYTIDQAVNDKAVLPLLYESRHVLQEVTQTTIDMLFNRITKDLSEDHKTKLKKKFSRMDQLNEAEQKIQMIALDVADHFKKNVSQPFKAQLTAPSKEAAIKYKKYFDDDGKISSEVIISPPDAREGYGDIYEEADDEVLKFWKKMMTKYKDEKDYNKSIIDSFKDGEHPQILIVVDKLLTGFDAPKNTVLYITRNLKEHNLLQAIARVNRLYEGKDFGFIIDYYGILGNLDQALSTYGSLSSFDEEDIAGTLTNVLEEVKTLPQKHSEVWDIFKSIINKSDIEAFERLLSDEYLREKFYEKLTAFIKVLSIAFSTFEFMDTTPKDKVDTYKKDMTFFKNLRESIIKRYSDEPNYKEYEPKIKKLVDTYIPSSGVEQLTQQVNIFDKEKFDLEVAKLGTVSSRADTIASRTKKAISEKMEEDPAFYTNFSKMLEESIKAYKDKVITEIEHLKNVTHIMDSIRNRSGDDIPQKLNNHEVAKAFYGITFDVIKKVSEDTLVVRDSSSSFDIKDISADISLKIDDVFKNNIVVDWTNKQDIKNRIFNQIEDILYSIKGRYNLSISTDDMDLIIEKSLSIGTKRYYQ
jgi:type I restriction enzyme R subunit